MPRRAAVYLAVVELLALAATTVLTVFDHSLPQRSVTLFVVLAGLGILAAEGTRTIERTRRRLNAGAGPHLNLSSVWTLAAALVLPPMWVAATVVVLYLHLWWRSWRRLPGSAVWRLAFNIAAVILSCDAAAAVARWAPAQFSLAPTRWTAALGIVAVIGCYLVVNLALAGGALLLLRDGQSLRSVLGTWGETGVEATMLCLGMLTAVLLAHPVQLLLLPLPLYVLQRSVEVRQLERAISTDPVTGLLNSATWRTLTERELARAARLSRPVAVLKIELDQHPAGPGESAVRAVADVIGRTIRSDDLCGRLDRGDFAVALPDTGLADATRIAQRIRDAVHAIHLDQADQADQAERAPHRGAQPVTEADAGQHPVGDLGQAPLTVSIGVACSHAVGGSVDDLLRAADNGLFAALYAGKDQVCAVRRTSPRPPGAPPRAGSGGRGGPTIRSA